ncbi:hypothetical protein HMPREF3188_00420 [Tissierellia bacterium KA00581]|nr:hypothetical protein HMPREF3188_00420 [Tissierellia bacterium KA00581]
MNSLRLNEIFNLVDKNSIVADIGTDHGIIPIMLSKFNLAKKIIATDISENSLNKLKEKLKQNDNINNIETRVSDGLNSFFEYEIDTIIISGMGGILIKDILNTNLDIAKTAETLILSPNNSLDVVRKFLVNNNFKIIDEKDVFENSKYYQILKVSYGKDLFYEDYEYNYGKILIKNKSKNLKLFLENELNKYSLIIDKIEKSSMNTKRIDDINMIIKDIKVVLHEF